MDNFLSEKEVPRLSWGTLWKDTLALNFFYWNVFAPRKKKTERKQSPAQKKPQTLDMPLEVGEKNIFSFVIWLNQHFKWSQHLCEAFSIKRKLQVMALIPIRSPIKHGTKCFRIVGTLLVWAQSDLMQEKKEESWRNQWPLLHWHTVGKWWRQSAACGEKQSPCRLTDFKAVRLCYVPPSLILGAAGWHFFIYFFPGEQIPLSLFSRYWQTHGSVHCFQDVFTLGSGYTRGPFHLQSGRLLCALRIYCVLIWESFLGYHIHSSATVSDITKKARRWNDVECNSMNPLMDDVSRFHLLGDVFRFQYSDLWLLLNHSEIYLINRLFNNHDANLGRQRVGLWQYAKRGRLLYIAGLLLMEPFSIKGRRVSLPRNFRFQSFFSSNHVQTETRPAHYSSQLLISQLHC